MATPGWPRDEFTGPEQVHVVRTMLDPGLFRGLSRPGDWPATGLKPKT
jgi:hypothetical protein